MNRYHDLASALRNEDEDGLETRVVSGSKKVMVADSRTVEVLVRGGCIVDRMNSKAPFARCVRMREDAELLEEKRRQPDD